MPITLNTFMCHVYLYIHTCSTHYIHPCPVYNIIIIAKSEVLYARMVICMPVCSLCNCSHASSSHIVRSKISIAIPYGSKFSWLKNFVIQLIIKNYLWFIILWVHVKPVLTSAVRKFCWQRSLWFHEYHETIQSQKLCCSYICMFNIRQGEYES